MMRKRITVFCSASYDIDAKYNRVAREFVRAASSCFDIVSGGTVKGTMGEIGDEISACGGYHIGVIPRFMERLAYPSLNETVWTETMSERKGKMREGSSAVIALPGGIGTLDELIETLTLKKLGKFGCQIYALNYEGFYLPFIGLLNHYVRTGMLEEQVLGMISFPETVHGLVSLLNKDIYGFDQD